MRSSSPWGPAVVEGVKRIHTGFSAPYSKQQYQAWFSFLASVVALCIALAELDTRLSIWMAIVYIVVFVITAVVYVVVSVSHPGKIEASKELEAGEDHGALWCSVCELKILPGSKTRHCSVCGQCVAAFDHHCFYLNHCIGKDNYKYFIILCLLLMTLLSISVRVIYYCPRSAFICFNHALSLVFIVWWIVRICGVLVRRR